MGAMTASGAGFASTPEVHAPNIFMVQDMHEQKKDQELALGIVDGLSQKERAAKIDAYFDQWNLPLAGHGMTVVKEADKYDLDWRLVAAIGMRESTGCKFAFAENNCFGWGRKVTFTSVDAAIVHITRNLAGEEESTAYHYAGKDTEGILAKYNSVIPTYTKEIFAIMDDISGMDISSTGTHLAMNE